MENFLETPSKNMADFIVETTKPINVLILERVGKIKILKKIPPFLQSLFFTLSISFVGLPWIITGIIKGPNPPHCYILGYIAVANALFSSFFGTYILYKFAKKRMSEIVQYFHIKSPLNGKEIWTQTFSIKKQSITCLNVAVFATLLVGFTAIISDKANSITLISASLGGFFCGYIIGSGIHLFVNFPSVVARFYLLNIDKVYKLAPVETSGMTSLFGISLDFMLIGSTVGTFALFILIIYLLDTRLYQTKFAYLPAIIAGIFILLVALTMLIRSIIIFTDHIKKEKNRVLSEFQELINEKFEDLNKNGPNSEIEVIKRIMEFYDKVKSSSTWPFEGKVIRNVLTSIFVPFLPALIQFAVGKIFPGG